MKNLASNYDDLGRGKEVMKLMAKAVELRLKAKEPRESAWEAIAMTLGK
jgi:hypothetical protein